MYSILIPTYNNPEYLKLCIESILENSYYDTHQLCIHVNGYNQKTTDYLTMMNIKYTISQNNIGPLALNHCINQSTHDKVILTNDDCYFTKNWDYYLHQWETKLDNEFPDYKQIIGYRRAEPGFGSFPPVCDAGKTINEFNIAKVNEYISKHSSHTPLTWHMQSLYPKDVFIKNPITNEFFPSSCVDLDYMMNFLRYYKNNNIKFLMFTAGDVFVYHFQGISRSNSKIPEVDNGNKFENKWKIGTETACNLLHYEEDKSIELINEYLSKHKTISTYISCYNSLFYQSTLEQTIRHSLLFSDEIVVVNSEHSTDGTSELLDQLHSEYPNIIKLYTFKEDYSKLWKTVAEKKTFALKHCTKDYCILQDDDECVHEQYANYIKQLPIICPDTLAFRFNTIHFYRSYNHYQPPKRDWYSKKIYMVKNIPEIEHGKVNSDPDNFIINNQHSKIPVDELKVPMIINTPVTSYHYGWCRNDSILLMKKYNQEIQWHGNEYWKTHKFPFKFDNPEKLPEFKGTHPRFMTPTIEHEEKLNSNHIKEFST